MSSLQPPRCVSVSEPEITLSFFGTALPDPQEEPCGFGAGGKSPSLHQMHVPLLVIGGTLLGSRVIQAHVFLARPPAQHPWVPLHSLCRASILKLPLFWAVDGFTRL